MNPVYGFFCMIILSAEASPNQMSLLEGTRAVAKTNVISLDFSESDDDKMGKKTLEEVHTYAELKNDPRASLPDLFTVCSTILITGYQSYEWPLFFNILDNNRGQFLALYHNRGVIKSNLIIGFHDDISPMVNGKILPLFPNQWTRSCMAVNTTSGLIHWVIEGTLVVAREFSEMKNPKSQPKDLSKRIVLGASFYGGSWYASTEKATNLDIYSHSLSIEKMKTITRGDSCVEKGDYLAWRDMEWILHGRAKKETIEKEATCEEKSLVDLYFAPFPGMDSCMHHCQNFGTRVPSLATFEEWTKHKTFLKKKLFDRGLGTQQIWLPITDRVAEGVWRDFYTGKVEQNYTLPFPGSNGADGGKEQNCARLLNENNWADDRCDQAAFGCMCSHKSSTNLTLKGLCPRSAIDVHYKPMNKETDIREMKLQGLTYTSIEYIEEKKIWLLDVIGSNITGTSTASFSSFTLGKHNWTIKGDEGCSFGDTYITELKMSGCQEGNFTCNNGQCISMDKRCNQLPDCRDESDEKSCRILLVRDGYNKKIPPYVLDDPVDVSVSIELLRLVAINEEDYSIDIQFEISLLWKDKRVTFYNLKLSDSLNVLTEEDLFKLWLPKVIYENTDQKENTRLGEYGSGEWETEVIVRREEKDGVMSGLEHVEEREIFKGSENSLVMNQTYTRTFQCNYKLSHYPFDTQVSESCSPHIHTSLLRLAL